METPPNASVRQRRNWGESEAKHSELRQRAIFLDSTPCTSTFLTETNVASPALHKKGPRGGAPQGSPARQSRAGKIKGVDNTPLLQRLEESGILLHDNSIDFERLEHAKQHEGLPPMKFTRMSIYPTGLVPVNSLRPENAIRGKAETAKSTKEEDTIKSSLLAINSISRSIFGPDADGETHPPVACISASKAQDKPISNLRVAAHSKLGFHKAKTVKVREWLETFPNDERKFISQHASLRAQMHTPQQAPVKRGEEWDQYDESVFYDIDRLNKSSIQRTVERSHVKYAAIRNNRPRFGSSERGYNPPATSQVRRQQGVLEERLADIRAARAGQWAKRWKVLGSPPPTTTVSPQNPLPSARRGAASVAGGAVVTGRPASPMLTARPHTAMG